MAKQRDYAAEYARRQEIAAQMGTTYYERRISRLEREGFTRSEARGHPGSGLTIARMREMGLPAARQNTARTGLPMGLPRDQPAFRSASRDDQRSFLRELFAGTEMSLRQQYAAYYGSP